MGMNVARLAVNAWDDSDDTRDRGDVLTGGRREDL